MVDLERLRTEPALFRAAIKERGGDPELVGRFLKLDTQWRRAQQALGEVQARINALGRTKNVAEENYPLLRQLKQQSKTLQQRLDDLSSKRLEVYRAIPNLLARDVPLGEGETANTVIRTVGQPSVASGMSHDELMTKLDWLDLTLSAQISGARFRFLKNEAAVAHLKLMTEAMMFAIAEGFIPVIPPVIVRQSALDQTGFFPFGQAETFQLDNSLYLIGSSEAPLVLLAGQEAKRVTDLPKRLVGFSSCFRKEAGSYGKDVKGMFRQHQFDKVELVSICHPDASEQEHQFLLSLQERFVQRWQLAYQVVLIGSGDLEAKAIKRFDLETWFPGQQRYRETHSASNCGDYQARRANLKLRGKQEEFLPHTLNATLATERLLLALVENNQQPDGSVNLPDNLRLGDG